MNIFNIYINKVNDDAIEDIEAVKNHFSFAAFFLNIFWFIHYRMWRETFVLIAVDAFLFLFFSYEIFGLVDVIIIQIWLSLLIGSNASCWYEKYLLKNNYKFHGCVFGKNKAEAKLRFIANYFKAEETKPDLIIKKGQKSETPQHNFNPSY